MNFYELILAHQLAEEELRHRAMSTTEYRLYYDEEGRPTQFGNGNYPNEGMYIVLDDPDLYYRANTLLLRVVNGVLTTINHNVPLQSKIVRAKSGQAVVRGHAAIPVTARDNYTNIEYYDRKTNN